MEQSGWFDWRVVSGSTRILHALSASRPKTSRLVNDWGCSDMSVYMPIYGAIVGGCFSTFFAQALNVSGPLLVVVAVFGAAIGLAGWIYSPLPATNGGMFAPPARKQKWGWTQEPAKEYKDPDGRGLMSQKFFGINWAEEDNDGE